MPGRRPAFAEHIRQASPTGAAAHRAHPRPSADRPGPAASNRQAPRISAGPPTPPHPGPSRRVDRRLRHTGSRVRRWSGVGSGAQVAGQFFARYLTGYRLSVDNLFAFVVVITAFAVSAAQEARVLLAGLVVTLMLRSGFVAVGAAPIHRFSVTFNLFGALLLFTAVWFARHEGVQPDTTKNRVLRCASRLLPTRTDYHGARLSVRVAGQRLLTPMLLVMIGHRHRRRDVRPGSPRSSASPQKPLPAVHRQRVRAHGAAAAVRPAQRVGAGNSATLCDLGVFVQEPAEPAHAG